MNHRENHAESGQVDPVWIRIVLLVSAVLVALGIAEIGLRLAGMGPAGKAVVVRTSWAQSPEEGWIEYDPDLGWYHQKNKSAVLNKNGQRVPVHTNSAGFRGEREYEKERSGMRRRILLLGDSFAFGFGVRDNETFSHRIEQARSSWEILNMGVAGYGLDQMLLAYRMEGVTWNPDDVVIMIYPEDFWRSLRAYADSGHAKPYFTIDTRGHLIVHNVPVPARYELNGEQFPPILERAPLVALLHKSAVFLLLKRAYFKLGKILGYVDPDTTVKWILGRNILNTLIWEIKHHQSRPCLVIAPSEAWVRDTGMSSLRASLVRFAEEVGVPFLDLTPVFQQKAKQGSLADYYIPQDGHWSALGHQIAAESLQNLLDKES